MVLVMDIWGIDEASSGFRFVNRLGSVWLTRAGLGNNECLYATEDMAPRALTTIGS